MEVGTSSSLVIDIVDQANVHSITASIKSMLDNFPQSWSDYFISRVPERLRSVKPEAYTPLIVSIGPFHHGDAPLNTMEQRKVQYLHSLLDRHPKISLDRYVEALVELETRARNCYAETIPYTKDEFVKMLLLDGCFLVELFRQYDDRTLRQENDQLFKNHWVFNAVHHDVLLLENQIPFFVLETLFNVIPPTGPLETHGLCHLIQVFLGHHKLLGHRDWQICRLKEGPLLLSVLKSITHFERKTQSQTTIDQPHPTSLPFIPSVIELSSVESTSLLHDQKNNSRSLLHNQKNIPTSLTFIPSVTELTRVGITFEESKSSNIFNVRFPGNGVFYIPSVVVDDRTESFLRNLIALEQTHSKTPINEDKNPIMDCQSQIYKIPTISAYVTLMDCLVNTSADVALLRDQRILHNQLGDDEEVAQLFNKLRTGIIMNPDKFYFAGVFQRVNMYYHTKWNEWWAMFFREFWSTPWKRASLFAATILLLCAVGQTVCSILQVLPHRSNILQVLPHRSK